MNKFRITECCNERQCSYNNRKFVDDCSLFVWNTSKCKFKKTSIKIVYSCINKKCDYHINNDCEVLHMENKTVCNNFLNYDIKLKYI